MRVGGNIRLICRVQKVELESYRGNDLLSHKKHQSLQHLPNMILKDFDDVYVEIKNSDPDILEFEARLTVVKTNAFEEAYKYLLSEAVDLEKARMLFGNLTKEK